MDQQSDLCCNGIEQLISTLDTPIYYKTKLYYIFNDRQICFCPSCGIPLKNCILGDRDIPENPDFCCHPMERSISEPVEQDRFDIFYQPFARRYFFSTAYCWREVEPEGTVFPEWDFSHCLYCGKKLPEPLLELWLKTVKQEFGVERMPILENMLPLIPEEFRTDAWWKQREL